MNNLLENQKISKRKSSGISKNLRKSSAEGEFRFKNNSRSKKAKSTRPAFRPEGVILLFRQNSRLIEGVKQSPARLRCRNHKTKEPKNPNYAGTRGEPHLTTYNWSGSAAPSGRDIIRFFTSSIVPAAALFLLVLGIIFVIYGRGVSFDWLSREVVNAGKDPGIQYNLALYAGINEAAGAQAGEAGGDGISGDDIPFDLTETFSWQNYKVKKGDSVSKIAAAFSVSMDAIIASNGISNARSLREGEVLKIPNMDGIPYTIKSGDSLSGISASMGVPLEAILDANDIQSDIVYSGMNIFIPGARMKREDLKMALGELFIYPLTGSRLSSPFGWRDDPFTGERRHHAALDLSAPQGTSVKAAMDGKISSLGTNATYGNYIIISHPGGYQTMYAHLSAFCAKKGDNVVQGAEIGKVGSTGYSTGPHLHFAVFKNGRAVNPLDFLNPQK